MKPRDPRVEGALGGIGEVDLGRLLDRLLSLPMVMESGKPHFHPLCVGVGKNPINNQDQIYNQDKKDQEPRGKVYY